MGKFHFASSFFHLFADHHSSFHCNLSSTTNPPPSTPSNTRPKTRPKPSKTRAYRFRNLLSVILHQVALPVGCCGRNPCKPHWSSTTLPASLHIGQDIDSYLAQPYIISYFGPNALGSRFDIGSLGTLHTLTLGTVSLKPVRQNGRLTSPIPFVH